MRVLWSEFEEEVRKYSRLLTPEQFNYAINISLKYNYLFTETPKAACSIIKYFLQRIELDNPTIYWDGLGAVHNRTFSPLLRPSQVGVFGNYLEEYKPFKFCFARNPYTRLLSGYLQKIKAKSPQKRKILEHLGKDPSNLNQHISFEEFINVVFEQSISDMDPHWRIQYYQTFQDTISYDFIGKLENFSEDLIYVFGKIGVSYENFPWNQKMNETGATNLMNNYYTPELIKMAQEKYAIDFGYFDYSPEFNF